MTNRIKLMASVLMSISLIVPFSIIPMFAEAYQNTNS